MDGKGSNNGGGYEERGRKGGRNGMWVPTSALFFKVTWGTRKESVCVNEGGSAWLLFRAVTCGSR